MVNFMVTLKENASPEELAKAKATAESQGGKIVEEFALIKGFTYISLNLNSELNLILRILVSVEYPDDHVGVLESNDHINVEKDSEVTTQ
ncbi:hypothetical protein MMC30_006696 [Trapelia coarctata]|nr:hypothetical protein [Trapelia coarctata]